jgi:hypothetical protein
MDRGSFELDPPAPEDEDNIILAALKQADRVSFIDLRVTVTNPLLERLSTIEWSFPKLEDLVLLSIENARLTLPSAFRWGGRARLGSLHFTRIIFPGLPQLLRSSENLVYLQLHKVLDPGLFTPETLTDALSGWLIFDHFHSISFPRMIRFVCSCRLRNA